MDRKELIDEAKKLAESEDLAGISSQVANLKKQWHRVGDEASLYETELQEQFEKYLNAIDAKLGVASTNITEKKEGIISEAKKVLNDKNFKKAGEKMEALFEDWKKAGHTTKEKDDALWEEFKAVRNEFFANKKAYFADLFASFEANKLSKEDLIKQVETLKDTDSYKKAADKLNDLMESWKQVGSAGKDNDENLWQAFSAARKAFYEKRSEYFSKMNEEYAQRAQAKRELIKQASDILYAAEFTPEEVEKIKELRNKWKEIGNAGRENEEALWKQFNDTLNQYFQEKRDFNN